MSSEKVQVNESGDNISAGTIENNGAYDSHKADSRKTRVISAIVMLVILAVILIIDDFTVTWVAMGVVYVMAFIESLKFYNARFSFSSALLMLLLWIGMYISKDGSLGIALGILSLSTLYVIIGSDGGRDFSSIFPFIYPTLPFVVLFDIYVSSIWYLIWLLVVVSLADIFAYYGGKRFGKRKLSLKSPGKTWEGVICGLIPSVIIGGISGIEIFGSFTCALLSSLVIVIFSIIGDLFESSLKRRIEVKDSGNIIPGHGGILDRIDAILFGAVGMILILSIV